MGRGLRGGFVPREIVAVLGGVGIILLAGNGLAPHDPLAPEKFAQAFAGGLILGETLRKDVARPGKRRFRIRHALFGVNKGGGHRFGEGAILTGELIGQRFEPALLRHQSACAPLGAVGEVNVFKDGQRVGGFDLGAQSGREEAAFLQRREDGFTPFVQFLQGGEAIADGGHRHFVEASRGFLAVAGNKGNRGVPVEQADDGFGLLGADIQFLGYDGCVVLHAFSLSVWRIAGTMRALRPPGGMPGEREACRRATVCFFAEKENARRIPAGP